VSEFCHEPAASPPQIPKRLQQHVFKSTGLRCIGGGHDPRTAFGEDRGCYDWGDDGGMWRLKPFAKWVTSWVPDSSSVNSSDKVPFPFRYSSVGSSGGCCYR